MSSPKSETPISSVGILNTASTALCVTLSLWTMWRSYDTNRVRRLGSLPSRIWQVRNPLVCMIVSWNRNFVTFRYGLRNKIVEITTTPCGCVVLYICSRSFIICTNVTMVCLHCRLAFASIQSGLVDQNLRCRGCSVPLPWIGLVLSVC